MKRLLLLTFLICGLSSFAAVITCSNNPNSPGQYDVLQDAVDAANANDTILVHASPTNYANLAALEIKYKAVTIIGAGYNNPNGANQFTNVGQIFITHASAGISGSGTKLIGLQITQIVFGSHTGGTQVTAAATLENITIERCRFDGVTGGFYNTSILFGWNQGGPRLYENINIRNCLFNGLGSTFRTDGGSFNNVHFDNCVFDRTGFFLSSVDIDLSSLYITNSIFSNFSSALFSFASSLTPNIVLRNNIFYKTNPSGCLECVFDNNLTYLCSDDNLIYTGNSGSTGGANIIGQDPQFVNFPIGAIMYDYTHNLNLQAGSPAIGSGISGTDMGIYGGVTPYEIGANPAIPQMQEITTPLGSTVSQGTSLNVQFKSYKQD